jgi:hypothetical protein
MEARLLPVRFAIRVTIASFILWPLGVAVSISGPTLWATIMEPRRRCCVVAAARTSVAVAFAMIVGDGRGGGGGDGRGEASDGDREVVTGFKIGFKKGGCASCLADESGR